MGNVTNNPTQFSTGKIDMAKKATKKSKSSKTAKQTSNPKFKVIAEFRDLLPDLTPEEYKELEASICKEGLREPLIVWKERGVLIDGHNRLKICKEHGKKYRIIEKSFASKEDVKLWILDNQAGRRNMTTFQRIEATLKLKDAIATEAKKNQQAGGGSVRQKVGKPGNEAKRTNKILGDKVGVSHEIIRKAEAVLEKYHEGKIEENVMNALRSGKAKISGIYNRYCKDQKTKQQPKRDITERSNSIIRLLKMQIAKAFPQMEDRDYIYKQISEWINEKKD